MAITIEANYSKKIGLPGYSSHQYSLTLRAELSDLNQVGPESQRLHGLLQASVDRELQQAGWLPSTNGTSGHPPTNGNGNGNGHDHPTQNGNGNGHGERWSCSAKQQALIVKIVAEHRLDKNDIERLALERFGKGVKQLNTLEASGLIEELFDQHPRPGQPSPRNGHGRPPQRSNYAVR